MFFEPRRGFEFGVEAAVDLVVVDLLLHCGQEVGQRLQHGVRLLELAAYVLLSGFKRIQEVLFSLLKLCDLHCECFDVLCYFGRSESKLFLALLDSVYYPKNA